MLYCCNNSSKAYVHRKHQAQQEKTNDDFEALLVASDVAYRDAKTEARRQAVPERRTVLEATGRQQQRDAAEALELSLIHI